MQLHHLFYNVIAFKNHQTSKNEKSLKSMCADNRNKKIKDVVNKKLALSIDIPVKIKSMAENVIDSVSGKSIFRFDYTHRHKINQHCVKFTFSDGSFVVAKRETVEGFDSQGKVVGLVKHGNKDILD